MTTTLDRRGEDIRDRSKTDDTLNRTFRPDIEGLRGVAVLLVVLYHAGVPFLPGGYVGVDVFFVISGFLITLHLADPTRGTPKLRTFYARRIRRLMPSALFVLLVTVIAARLAGPALQATQTAWDGLASVGLVANYRFAAAGLDYLQANAAPSPLQHFWSLAAEEQFYLIWPILMIAVIGFTRRYGRRVRTLALAGTTGLVVVGSFTASVLVTNSDAPTAYFGLHTRAWELAAGAFIAIGLPLLARIPAGIAAGMTWVGLGTILVTAVVFTDTTVFPGALAAIPVAGAALIIAGGVRGNSVSADKVLDTRVLRFLGSVSYTWYLWHWPVLILAPAVFGYTLGLGEGLAMSVLSLWFAVLTSLFVERPLLRKPLLTIPWFKVAAAGALVTAVVAGAVIAFPPQIPGATATIGAGADKATAVAGPVTPAVADAAKDLPKYPAECIVQVKDVTSPSCNLRADGTDRGEAMAGRVVLLGDSHAGHWYPVARSLANSQRTDVEVLNKSGCPLADVTVINPALKREYTECDQWRENVLDRFSDHAKPSVVLISALNQYTNDEKALSKGWQKTMSTLDALGVPVVYLVDTPHPDGDVPTCMAEHLDDWSACSIDRSKALRADSLKAAIADGDFKNATAVDVNDYLCPAGGDTCPVVRQGTLLYRDDSHMTDTAATELAPLVLQELDALGVLD